MHIARYQPADLAQVIALWNACGLTRPWNDPATDIAFCMQSPQSTLLVGRDEAGGAGIGPVIGTVMAGHDGHRGWMYYVAVAPDHQGAGLGQQLMAAAEAWLRDLGVPKVDLMVRNSNGRAIGFYRKLGYLAEPVTILSKWLRQPPVPSDGR